MYGFRVDLKNEPKQNYRMTVTEEEWLDVILEDEITWIPFLGIFHILEQ